MDWIDWSLWHQWSVTFSTYWIGSQMSLKWQGWGSTPLNLRQWFFALNWCSPCLERSQLTWFSHLVRMLSGSLFWKVLQAFPPGRRTWGRHRFRWKIISLHCTGNDWGKGKGSPGPHVVAATSATWHWIGIWRWWWWTRNYKELKIRIYCEMHWLSFGSVCFSIFLIEFLTGTYCISFSCIYVKRFNNNH